MAHFGSSFIMTRNIAKKVAIFGICLLFIGALPLVSEGQEDLQAVYDHRGTSGGALMGWNLTGVGDINNDGDDDYAMGNPGENKVYVFLGPLPRTVTPASAGWVITGPSSSDFGWDVQGLGDYDSDGYDDLIVGAPGIDKAYVFNGRTRTGSYTSADHEISGTTGEKFGHSVCGINYDGDIGMFAVVGAPLNTHFIESQGDFSNGAVFLINLTYFDDMTQKDIGAGTDANYTYKGDVDSGEFGFAVRNLGDISGDSIDDLGMSDPYYSPSGFTNKGSLHIQYGKNLMAEPPEKLTSSLDGIISGKANGSKFGWAVKGLGDIRGGSEDDFMIGAPFENEGWAYLFFGIAGAFNIDLASGGTADNEFNGTAADDRFGMSFDVTMIAGQSTTVVSIGAPGYDNGTSRANAGAVYSFWSWASIESANNANSKHFGDQADENLGYSLTEVNYTLNIQEGEYVIGVLASSPYYGTTDGGRLQIFKRNQLPTLGPININFKKGSTSTFFTIGMEYEDADDDPPVFINVVFYYDQSGNRIARTVPMIRQPADIDAFSDGVTYEAITTLPNSITRDVPDQDLYVQGITRAVRGSISEVFSLGGIVNGPTVDGILPSAADNLNEVKHTSLPEEELIPGTFKISWEWPEDNDGFSNTESEPVDKLEIRYLAGNETLDASNWDSATPYKTYQVSTEIEEPFTADNLLVGYDTNDFKPMLYYSVAMRAWDDVGNEGNISATINAQAYWRRPQIPEQCDFVSTSDYKGESGMGDDGGKLIVNFGPPQMTYPSDIFEYRVFVTGDITDLKNVTDIEWEVDRVILKDEEEAFYNYTFVIDSYHGGDLEDGQEYYVGVVPVNWLGQHTKLIRWSDTPAKVINDNETPIPKIRDVDAISVNEEGKIRVTWTPTTLPRFTEYEIYGQSYYFDDIENAILIATVTERTASEYLVEDLSGNPILEENLYSFAILVKDHNDHTDYELDANNTVHGVKYIGSPVTPPVPQIQGVSMIDVPNDGGSALTLSWFKSFSKFFWQYNIYFDDEMITDISSMEPQFVIGSSAKTDTMITEFNGKPLIDGVEYYAAITIVDWNLFENILIDRNNTASAESVNQSDHEAPRVTPTNLGISEPPTNTEFTLTWDPVSKEDVIDFHHYLVTITGPKGIDRKEIEHIDASSILIDRLTRGTEYNVNISVVDDNGNIGPGSSSLKITTNGTNQRPWVEQIILTIGEDLYYLKNTTDRAPVDLNKDSIIYFTGQGDDDYTKPSRLLFSWNLTLPSGETIEKSSYQFDLDISEKGEYEITLVVTDQEGLKSEPFTIFLDAEERFEDTKTNWAFVIAAIIGTVILAAAIVIFVLFSGSKSQKKQRMEEYEEKRQNIDAMEPIYTNLPTWTCDCGTTQVALIDHAYCNSCYQSHEAVPIDGVDEYLSEHDLVLAEMKIDIPPGWQGQDSAKADATNDLVERKKRALDSLNEEFRPWLKGTEYESELKELVEEAPEGEDETQKNIMHHAGAIVPGQAPPSGPAQGGPIVPGRPGPIVPGRPGPIVPGRPGPIVPGQPGPIRPMVGGQPQIGQARPPVVPQVGAPGQRPPIPQVGPPQQRPPQPPEQS